jgi:hypothetical protein
MQPQRSTSAPGADAHANSMDYRASKHIRTAVTTLEHQRITKQFLAANASLLATHAPTSQQQYITANATPTTEGGKQAHEPLNDMLHDNPASAHVEFVDFPYCGIAIHVGLKRPHATSMSPASRH